VTSPGTVVCLFFYVDDVFGKKRVREYGNGKRAEAIYICMYYRATVGPTNL